MNKLFHFSIHPFNPFLLSVLPLLKLASKFPRLALRLAPSCL
jgi:hypothetical protein